MLPVRVPGSTVAKKKPALDADDKAEDRDEQWDPNFPESSSRWDHGFRRLRGLPYAIYDEAGKLVCDYQVASAAAAGVGKKPELDADDKAEDEGCQMVSAVAAGVGYIAKKPELDADDKAEGFQVASAAAAGVGGIAKKPQLDADDKAEGFQVASAAAAGVGGIAKKPQLDADNKADKSVQTNADNKADKSVQTSAPVHQCHRSTSDTNCPCQVCVSSRHRMALGSGWLSYVHPSRR